MEGDGLHGIKLSGYVPGRHALMAALRVAHSLDVRSQPLDVFHKTLAHLPSDGLFSLEDLLDGEEVLVRAGVALRSSGVIALCEQWQPGEQALDILATRYLERFPPSWLGAATRDGDVDDSFIPADDGATLNSLFDDPDRRDALLLALGTKFDDDYRKELGKAGELHVVEQCKHRLMRSGAPLLAEQVLHVSQVSDTVGYDVRSPTLSGGVHRLEVKTTVARKDLLQFIVSRNEFRTGLADPRWRLVVCIRTPAGEVRIVGWCAARELSDLLPPDRLCARWQTVSFLLPGATLMPHLPPLDD